MIKPFTIRLLLLAALSLSACAGPIPTINPEAGIEVNGGPASVSISIDGSGEIKWGGQIAKPIIGNEQLGVSVFVGFEQTVADLWDKTNYLVLLWNDSNGDVTRDTYAVGSRFDISFDQRDWVSRIYEDDQGNFVVAIERDRFLVENGDGDNSSASAKPRNDEPDDSDSAEPIISEADLYQLVENYDQARRWSLENLDLSGLDVYARGKAYQDRVDAIEMHTSVGCAWVYDFRDIEFTGAYFSSEESAVVSAMLDLDGSIFCGSVERREWSFIGPCSVEYDVDAYSDGWYVTDVTTLYCQQECDGDCE